MNTANEHDSLIEKRLVHLKKVLFPTPEEKQEIEFLEEHIKQMPERGMQNAATEP